MLGAITTCPFIPTSVTCQQGMAAVEEMDTVFRSAMPEVQTHFQSAHDAIMAQYNGYSWYTCYVELYNGEVCSLGVEATKLENQIQNAMGQSPSAGAPTGAFDLSSLIGGPGLLIGGVVLILVLDRKI